MKRLARSILKFLLSPEGPAYTFPDGVEIAQADA
ncbi:hypothetical protein B0G81_6883 [Paraburkholderia sp. BL6665CI2N2]|nr:hypothetical protein B0G81_6883 [Paraburkholderia sp. BL6665CI2N2]